MSPENAILVSYVGHFELLNWIYEFSNSFGLVIDVGSYGQEWIMIHVFNNL